MTRRPTGAYWSALLMLVLAAATGCGSGRFPVTGKVTYEDGTPLDEGTVAGEASINGKLISVQARVEKDGSFKWGTEKAADGAFPGKYRVVVLPRVLGDSEIAKGMKPAVADKYGNYDTSGITHEVTNGPSELNIKLSKARGR